MDKVNNFLNSPTFKGHFGSQRALWIRCCNKHAENAIRLMTKYLVDDMFDKAVLEFVPITEDKIYTETEIVKMRMKQATNTKEMDEII